MAKPSVTPTFLSMILLALTLAFAGCGGSPQTQPGTKQSQPLDPQGNWLFTITDNRGDAPLVLGGELFELNPPTVTSNPIATPADLPVQCFGSFTMSGQASGTDSISLTAQQNGVNIPISIALTGTIAADQAHMSGSFATNTSSGCFTGTGTWSAQLLAPVTGNWTGTVSNANTNLTITASLTEDTSQTSITMGHVTGTVTLLGSPCFPSADTFNVTGPATPAVHVATDFVIFGSSPDANGVTITAFGIVDQDATTLTLQPTVQPEPPNLQIHGGVCDGQSFTGTLRH